MSRERSRSAESDGTIGGGGGGGGAFATPGKRTLTQRLARSAAAAGPVDGEALTPRGAGAALPEAVQGRMEQSFATSFADVRVHEDDRAQSIDARAFARGNDLHFAPGEYDPGSERGQEVLGHELAHVVQQRGGRVAVQDLEGAINDDPGLEAEADEAGRRAARGEPAGVSGAAGATATSPSPQLLRIQRLTFRVERGDREQVKVAKLQFIHAQRELLLSFRTLYFDREGNFAYPAPGDGLEAGHRVESELLPPIDTKLAEAFHAKYLTRFKSYKVDFITHPDVDPQPLGPDRGAHARVAPPFPVISAGNRGEGGDIGRTLGGDWAWDVNPDFQGTALAANLGGNFHPVRMHAEMLAQNGGLPPDRRLSFFHGQNLRRLPAPNTQPFVFFVAPDVHDRTHRHDDRGAMTNETFTSMFSAQMSQGFGFRQQEQLSTPHETARAGSGRDPGTFMGGAASSLMSGGWSAVPNRGVLGSHEWCHLVGDGDGGACNGKNLVIGTNQVNTEQLAMENGLRGFRDRLDQRGLGIYIDCRAVGTEVDSPDPDVGKVLRADWISYSISIRSVRDGGQGTNLNVHTQVMDAARGTITRGEFDGLRGMIETKIAAVMRGLQPPQAQEPHFFNASWPSDRGAQSHPHVQHNAEFFPGSPTFQRPDTGGGFGGQGGSSSFVFGGQGGSSSFGFGGPSSSGGFGGQSGGFGGFSPPQPQQNPFGGQSSSSGGFGGFSPPQPQQNPFGGQSGGFGGFSQPQQDSQLMPPPSPETTVRMLIGRLERGDRSVIPQIKDWVLRCTDMGFVDQVLQFLRRVG